MAKVVPAFRIALTPQDVERLREGRDLIIYVPEVILSDFGRVERRAVILSGPETVAFPQVYQEPKARTASVEELSVDRHPNLAEPEPSRRPWVTNRLLGECQIHESDTRAQDTSARSFRF